MTAGFGPRFQHSTGQFHKGGRNIALFIQITSEPKKDEQIPTERLAFGALIRAQTLGNYEALIEVTVQWWTHKIGGLHKTISSWRPRVTKSSAHNSWGKEEGNERATIF